VDDSDDVREVLTVLLEGEGLRVLPIEDGETAMLMTRRVRPVLITLDIRLPHEDGGELLRRLKSDPETSDIPVVLVSGHSSMHELGESLGADATVAKPFDIEEMQQLVRSLVERAR
jgi:CheY-like chemotaxis protein